MNMASEHPKLTNRKLDFATIGTNTHGALEPCTFRDQTLQTLNLYWKIYILSKRKKVLFFLLATQ